MKNNVTIPELEALLGQHCRNLRLQKNLPQDDVALKAGISKTAIRNLESGAGATIKTLIAVLRALDKADWLNSLAPVVSINPLHMVREKPMRERARKKGIHGQT